MLAGQQEGEVRRLVREQVDGLVDGHGLAAGHDALARSELGVLPGDEHLARELLLGQGLDGAARGAVVAGHHRIHLVLDAGERVLHDLEGLHRLPVVRPLLGDDLDVAAVDVGLQHLQLPFARQVGVVVGRAAADQHVAALRPFLDEVLGLLLAHPDRVEGDVDVEVAVEDESVVGDDGHAGLVRGVHDGGRGLRVGRHHHEHVHALGEQVLRLGVLQGGVVVGRLHEDPRPLLLGRGHEEVAVALPALLLEGREGEPDRGPAVGTTVVLAASADREDGQDEGEAGAHLH